jgi:recombinational DNA repair ATPase RecF
MAALGGRVSFARREALGVLSAALNREAGKLNSPWADLDLDLATGFAGVRGGGAGAAAGGTEDGNSDAAADADAGAAALGRSLLEEIRSRADEERRARRCLVGPHRDDVRATVDGVPVTERVSSGENRTLVLAWTLAEAGILAEAGGRPPLLAFDDFDSEWDPSVLAAFAEALDEEAQVLLTSARPESLRGLPLPGGWLFRMEKGRPHREGILGGGRAARSEETEQQAGKARR